MQLNEIHDPHEHASVSLKVILLVFAVILVGVLGYLVWDYQNTPDTTDYSLPKLTTTKTESAETATAVNCGDEAYGFELTFSDDWDGYKIKEVAPDYALVTCYFTMPTTTADPIWVAAGSDHDAAYASVFAVSVYTPAQWTLSQEEANKPAELGHNANYYWGWSQAQAIPTDLEAVYADAKNLVATFSIAP
ncbi:MAG: hypothetical protein WD970_00200 [Patescibacteria group bacterium]